MTKFHHLKITNIRRETADCVSISFDVPTDLTEKFAFKQGQYLTLRVQIDGAEIRRSYSICSAPSDGELRVAIKKVPEGVFSTFANEVLKTGDVLEVMPAQGRFFTEMKKKNAKTYLGFAAGSGITPILSILKTVLSEEAESRFILFYGNKNFDGIIFREELEALKNRFPARLSLHHILSREKLSAPLFEGRLSGEKCAKFSKHFFDPKTVDEVFICGPEDMTFDIKNALISLEIDQKRVHFELFGTPSPKKPTTETTPKPKNDLEADVVIIQDGTQFIFRLAADGENILDAAMRAGADLPFSCKGGVCCTCKARVLDGEVEMDINYALEPEEVEAGYILTCQAHPRSARVMVTFD
jgi:ring-1,2-phenylacetyl-CoA epoxidase subunit PaaE